MMLTITAATNHQEAVAEFQDALRHVFWETLRQRLQGKPTQLLDFEQVRDRLHLREQQSVGLREVPLSHIIGSVGRATEFSRSFLPKREDMRDRWSKVYELATTVAGLEPIEVYKICDSYFVVDGNHRVSVAHRLQSRSIEARVVEWTTPVCLNPDSTLSDLEREATGEDV